MTEIKFLGDTYRGTAEGDHGVFTDSDGDVYAGQIVGDYPCVGVHTWTDGTTSFVECDADGEEHGREMVCTAGGDTEYYLCEHGDEKEHAALRANGTCAYNGEACRADFAPFVALKAMVLPIKARPPLMPPQLPLCHMFYPASAPQSVPSAIVLALAGAGNDPRRQGAHLPPSPSACVGLVANKLAKQMHRASNLDDAPAEGCNTRAPQPHA